MGFQNERLRHVWPSNSFKKPVLAGWPNAENTSTNLNRSRELTTSQGLQLPGSNLIRSRAYASTANETHGPNHPSFASINDFSTAPTRRPNSIPPALSRLALPTSSTSLSNNPRTPSRAGLSTNPYDDANDNNGGPNDDYAPASQRPRAAPHAPSNRAHDRPTGFPSPAQAGSPRASPNASIAVIVRAPDGSELEFRLKRSTPLGKMMASLRARKRLGGGVRFVFEGVRVLEGSTCQSVSFALRFLCWPIWEEMIGEGGGYES